MNSFGSYVADTPLLPFTSLTCPRQVFVCPMTFPMTFEVFGAFWHSLRFPNAYVRHRLFASRRSYVRLFRPDVSRRHDRRCALGCSPEKRWDWHEKPGRQQKSWSLIALEPLRPHPHPNRTLPFMKGFIGRRVRSREKEDFAFVLWSARRVMRYHNTGECQELPSPELQHV